MAEETVKRAKRTVDQRIEEIDKKIAALEAKKADIMKPAKMKEIMEKAAGAMSPEEIAEKLGIKL